MKGSIQRFSTIDRLPLSLAAWLASCAWDKRKVRIALRLRRETTMTLKWMAEQLAMGTWANAASRLYDATPYKALD